MVPIARLRPADSPRRSGEDPDHVRLLAEAAGQLPPILVHQATMRVIDGMHRLRAAMLRGETQIAVEFFHGSEAEAFARGVRENVAHGLPLSRADREAAAMRLLASHGDWSNRALAEVTGLSPSTIAAVRARSTGQIGQSNTRLGRDGRHRPVDPAEGRMRAQRLLAARPGAPLREIASESGISVSTALDVRRRIERGEEIVPRRKHSGQSVARASDFSPSDRNSQPNANPSSAKYAAPIGNAGPTGETLAESPSAVESVVRNTFPLLQSLRRDPSLRFTETGRTLLQWLSVHEAATGDTRKVVESIPEHCRESVARLAWSCAEIWRDLAHNLQRCADPDRPAPAQGAEERAA